MTTFTGQYVQRNNTGEICDVHVVDASGNQNSLDPSVYTTNGLQPPIGQLPDLDTSDIPSIPKNRTLKSMIGWGTLAALIMALVAATLSVQSDCYGVASSSEQCLWARSLFLVTSGLFFIVAWPVCFVIAMVAWWWKDIRE